MATAPEVFILPYDAQPMDHGGDPVAPLANNGEPYRYAVDQPDRQRRIYSTSADGILSVLIGGYDATETAGVDADQDRQLELDRLDARADHGFGVAVTIATNAIIDGAPDQIVATLQRATNYRPPLSLEELPSWNERIPLVLIGSFYQPHTDLLAPDGNIVLLDSANPDAYLDGLARAGVIALSTHARYTHGTPTATIDTQVDPSAELHEVTNLFRQALVVLDATPPAAEPAVVDETTVQGASPASSAVDDAAASLHHAARRLQRVAASQGLDLPGLQLLASAQTTTDLSTAAHLVLADLQPDTDELDVDEDDVR